MLQIKWSRRRPPVAEPAELSIQRQTEAERRGAPRQLTLLRVALLHAGGTSDLCIIRNLSGGGVSASVYRALDKGESVQIEFRSDERLSGEVIWTRGQEVGIAFPANIDVEAVLASRWVNENGKQQRLPRINLECGCRIRVGSNFYVGRLRDISQGGAKVEVQRPFKGTGDAILTLPGYGIVECTIRWSSKATLGLSFNERLPFAVLAQWLQAQRAKQKPEPVLERGSAHTELSTAVSADKRPNFDSNQEEHSFSRFYETMVADELREVATRYQQQSAELVLELRHDGTSDQLVQQTLDRLTASYEAQILDALRGVGKAGDL
jgi:hypothetical protein